MAVKVEMGLEDLSAEKIVSQILLKQITVEEVFTFSQNRPINFY
jgi:hypothetical protein